METLPTYGSALSRTLSLGGNGPSVAVKECLDIQGIVTRCGSRALEDCPPAGANAAVVETLLSAGCAIVGTANMHELAFGITGVNSYLGTPVNPHWPDRIPGGSSSGSAAAVAGGACDFSVGTDTGGSIRLPACCTGVYGMKPTFGRISRMGATPVESSLDCIGPMARTAAMLTRAMECIDPSFLRVSPDGSFRLACVAVEAKPEVAEAIATATNGLSTADIALSGLQEAYDAGMVVINAEVAAAFGALARRSDALDATVRARILAAADGFDAAAFAAAEAVRMRFRQAVDDALDGFDALILPTMPVVPPLLSEAGDMRALLPLTAFVRPFNLSGHPAVTIPIVTANGLPAGIQLVGRHGEDATLCAVAEWIERRLPRTSQINGDRPL